MIEANLKLAAITAFIPLIIGFVWYNPKVFGTAWMKGAGLDPDNMKGGNMLLVFVITYVFGFFVSVGLTFDTIHQFGLQSLTMPEKGGLVPTPELKQAVDTVSKAYSGSFLTFHHGVLHAVLISIMYALPILAIGAMFERRGFKYILINFGFWALCLALMGGIICKYTFAF
jgi:hypothetical protein